MLYRSKTDRVLWPLFFIATVSGTRPARGYVARFGEIGEASGLSPRLWQRSDAPDLRSGQHTLVDEILRDRTQRHGRTTHGVGWDWQRPLDSNIVPLTAPV